MNVSDAMIVDTQSENAEIRSSSLRRYPVLVIAALSVLVLLPVLFWGFPVTSHDSMVHVRWQNLYAKQLWSGDLFPRWIRDMNYGLGSPAFFIYPPLPHYVAALLGPLSGGAAWVQRRLALATLMACFLGSVGCFFWLKQITRERNSALIGSIVYLMAPYHLFLDIYYRGAYAELWAFTWAPFMLAATHLFASQRSKGIVIYTLSASALLFSHAPSALFVVPLCLAYAGLVAAVNRRSDILLWSAICMGTAIMMSGAYLSTALTQQSYIRSDALFSGRFFELMVFASWKTGQLAVTVTVVLQTLITLALGFGPLKAVKQQDRWAARIAIVGTLLIFFLTTPWSALIWKLIPTTQKIQFSWRLMTAQTLLLALAAALHLRMATTSRDKAVFPKKWTEPALLLLLLVINIGMHQYAKPGYDVDLAARGGEVSEYQLGDHKVASKYFHEDQKIAFTAGTGTVSLQRWEPRHVEFQLNATTAAELVVKQSTYTGWDCRTSTANGSCDIVRAGTTGDLVRLRTSAGVQHVELNMTATPQEHAGKLASIGGIVVFLILVGSTVNKERKAFNGRIPVVHARPSLERLHDLPAFAASNEMETAHAQVGQFAMSSTDPLDSTPAIL